MSVKSNCSEFAILGGGIAGLSMAIGLKNIGKDVKVFEAAPGFKPFGAGITLAINAMKAYRYLAIHRAVLERGNPISGMIIKDQKGGIISSSSIDHEKWGDQSLAIHRADLQTVLLAQLDETTVVTGKKAADIEQADGMYMISFEDGTEVRAKYVIDAEGIHSVVREKFLPDSMKRFAGYTCWRGIAHGVDVSDELSETWGEAGRFGFVPLTQNRIYWFAVKNAKQNDEKLKSYSKEQVINNYSGYHEPIQQIIEATEEQSIMLNDIIDLKPIKQYAFGNLVLIGDAAHATTPNMGQGACQAVEDAAVLTHCLDQEKEVSLAFQRFESSRMKRTHGVVNKSWQLGKIGQWENPIATRVRNRLFKAIPSRMSEKQFDDVYDFNLDAI